MKKLVILFAVMLLSACINQQENTESPVEVSNNLGSPSQISQDENGYYGEILAGDTTPLIVFNQKDYENALNSDKTILLYFWAKWCPTCKRELEDMIPAFDQLAVENLVAFRVNYKDDETDDLEKSLAKEHSVSYQHTKVFIKNRQRIEKTPETWSTEKFLEEIPKIAG